MRTSIGTDGQVAQRSLRNQICGVRGDATVESGEILGNRSPGEVQIDGIAVPPGDLSPDDVQRRIVDGRVRDAVLSDHLGGDTLADLGEVPRIGQQPQIGVRMHVDEAGGQDVTWCCIDDSVCTGKASGLDECCNGAITDENVPTQPRGTGAVDDVEPAK